MQTANNCFLTKKICLTNNHAPINAWVQSYSSPPCLLLNCKKLFVYFSHLFWGLGRRAYIYYLSDIIIISNMCIFLRCILRIYSLNVKLLHKNLAPHLHASEAHRRHELHGRHFSRAWKTLPKISRCDKNVQKRTKTYNPASTVYQVLMF